MSNENIEDSINRSGQTFPLREAYPFAKEHGLESESQKIKSTKITWQRATKSGVRRGYIIRLLNKKGLLDKFVQEHWQYGGTTPGKTMIAWYTKISEEYDNFLVTGNDNNQDLSAAILEDSENLSPEETLEFAFEAHLRDFIAKHLSRLESGLQLYESANKRGVEFVIDSGRIDILAIDSTGKYVVIELKLSQGRNKALGQLLYYMSWVDENLGNAPCRGVIVASEISDELAMAVSRVPGITLAKYKMAFDIETVKQV